MTESRYLTNTSGRPRASTRGAALTNHNRRGVAMATHKVGVPEQWRVVKGTNGLYEVSNQGRVCSRFGKGRRILTPGPPSAEYPSVAVGISGARRRRSVHRLVAAAFIPNPESKPQVNHLDGCKWNNHVGNLEWATAGENSRHAIRTGLTRPRRGEAAGTAVLTRKDVETIRNMAKTDGAQTIARRFNVSRGCVNDILRGRRWKHLGPPPQRLPGSPAQSVSEIDSNGQVIAEFSSMRDAERRTGIHRNVIKQAARTGRPARCGRRFAFSLTPNSDA